MALKYQVLRGSDNLVYYRHGALHRNSLPAVTWTDDALDRCGLGWYIYGCMYEACTLPLSLMKQ